MQSIVPRDENSRSDYGMIAVDPTRVTKGFSATSLIEVIEGIEKASNGLLQIVNYNGEPTQYVVAGDLTSLTSLMHATNTLKAAREPPNMSQVIIGAVEQA